MDILDRIDLTPRVVAAYQAFMKEAAKKIVAAGVHPSQIPDEQAVEQNDGSLLIWIDLLDNKGKVEFTVPKGDWAWHDRN